MMTPYSKYTMKLASACLTLQSVVAAIAQAPKCTKVEDIDARLNAADELIKYATEVKRSLLYFRNRVL